MRKTLTAMVTIFALAGCGQGGNVGGDSTPAEKPSVVYTAEEIQAETDRLNAWFDEKFEEGLKFSPIQQTFLGRDTDQDKIDDFSIEAQDAQLEWTRAASAEMKEKFDYDKLSPEAKTSWDISEYQLQRAEAAVPFRTNNYIFDQMSAVHTFFPQLLIAFHRVEDGDDMDNYLSRISESARGLDQLIELSKVNAATGVHPPYFAYESVIDEATKIITGAPFDDSGTDSDIWADAKTKIAGLQESGAIDQAKADQLTNDIREALINDWMPAYQRLIAWQEEDRVNASEAAQGVSSLPNGEAYYNDRLAAMTTTALTADEIHEIGLAEVARLQAEMVEVKDEFGFDGSLQEFFAFLRDTKDDERLYYPNTDEGRQGYIDDATAAIENLKSVLPDYFGILPKADLVVKRVGAVPRTGRRATTLLPRHAGRFASGRLLRAPF